MVVVKLASAGPAGSPPLSLRSLSSAVDLPILHRRCCCLPLAIHTQQQPPQQQAPRACIYLSLFSSSIAMRPSIFVAFALLALLAGLADARRKVPVALPVDGDGVPNPALGNNQASGGGPTVALQVTLSAPPARLPSVPIIVLPTIVAPVEVSSAAGVPSPFAAFDTPSIVIDLPALPPLNFPNQLPPLQYFISNAVHNATFNSSAIA